jgi:hypothetical protein
MAFPSSPTNGQQATVNGTIYSYNSSKTAWVKVNAQGSSLSVLALAVTGSNTSISTSSGALVVTGGAGIGGNLNVGGSLNVGSINNTIIGNTVPAAGTFSTLVASGLTASTLAVGNVIVNSSNNNVILTTGALGIGTTPTGKLHVRHDAGSGDSYTVKSLLQNTEQLLTLGSYYQTANTAQYAYIDSTNSSGNTAQPLILMGAGNERMRVHPNGNVLFHQNVSIYKSLSVGTTIAGNTGEIRATNYITAFYSDRRLKSNIQVIDNALDRVEQLTGVFYTQNQLAEQFGYNDYSQQVGLFAQDLQKVLPPVVKPAPFDISEQGTSISGQNYLTVQYEKIIPLLVEAIKELRQEVNQLKGK